MSEDRADELEKAGFKNVSKSGGVYTATYNGTERGAKAALPPDWRAVDVKGDMDEDVSVAAKPEQG